MVILFYEREFGAAENDALCSTLHKSVADLQKVAHFGFESAFYLVKYNACYDVLIVLTKRLYSNSFAGKYVEIRARADSSLGCENTHLFYSLAFTEGAGLLDYVYYGNIYRGANAFIEIVSGVAGDGKIASYRFK